MKKSWVPVVFVAVAYGVPWLGWSLKAILHLQWDFWGKLAFYSGSAASLGGLLAVYLSEGSAGVRDRLRRAVTWRVPIGWWAFALLLPIAWSVGFAAIQHFREPGSVQPFNPSIFGYWFQWSTLLLLIPPPGEDFAWRGYLFPTLLRRFSPLTAAVVLGVVWSVWHAPLYVDRIMERGWIWAVYFTTTTTFLCIMISLVQLRTGSLLLAMVLHFAWNLTNQWSFFEMNFSGNTMISSTIMQVLLLALVMPLLLSSDPRKVLRPLAERASPPDEAARASRKLIA